MAPSKPTPKPAAKRALGVASAKKLAHLRTRYLDAYATASFLTLRIVLQDAVADLQQTFLARPAALSAKLAATSPDPEEPTLYSNYARDVRVELQDALNETYRAAADLRRDLASALVHQATHLTALKAHPGYTPLGTAPETADVAQEVPHAPYSPSCPYSPSRDETAPAEKVESFVEVETASHDEIVARLAKQVARAKALAATKAVDAAKEKYGCQF